MDNELHADITARPARCSRKTHTFVLCVFFCGVPSLAAAAEPAAPAKCASDSCHLEPAPEASSAPESVSDADAAVPASDGATATTPPPADAHASDASTWQPVEPALATAPHSPELVPVPPPVAVSQTKDARFFGMRLPAFIAFSVGSLGAGGAVVTRLAATSGPYSDPKLSCAGRCADEAHRLVATSAVLAGIAVAGLGAGVVLALTDSERGPQKLAPVLKVGVSPSKAAASATWTF